METVPNQEIWQVEANGQVFDANFDELTSWIADGSVLKMDRVRRGNLRWIEAGKVPTLAKFFNAKDTNGPSPPVITASHVVDPSGPQPTSEFVNAPFENKGSFCAVHTDAPARYLCDTCANLFCKACPTSYGSSVKICPFCGAMCKAIEEAANPVVATQNFTRVVNSESFGFADLGRAFAHPFKFKVSLLLGGLMFTIFTLGQSVTGFGGMFMMFSGLMAGMAANTLSFGIMANTIENFSQGKLNENFMPSFDEFSMWDDVIHPFFLSIGVYVSSFGPLIAAFLVAFFLLAKSFGGMDGVKSDAARTVDPGMTYAVNSVKQSERVKEILQKDKEFQQKRVEAVQKAVNNGEELNMTRPDYDQEKEFEELANMAQQHQKAQLESAVGKSPETKEQEQAAMIKDLLGYGTAFVVVAGLALVWGLFFFPAACAVAGYTRSLGATLNPTVGIDTIRRLGGSYILILLMAGLLAGISLVLTSVFSGIFAAFDMPAVGNLPAKAIGSFIGFYLSVVFSCILGYALFKAADRLRLPS